MLTAPPPTLPFRDLLAGYRHDFETAARTYLETKRAEAEAMAPASTVLVETVTDLVMAGGKRLRPALVHFGYEAAGGAAETASAPDATLPVALASELLHTYLLIHDDIMDHAELRRGRPTAHQSFGQRHRAAHWPGDAADYGRSMAILAGDLAASYAFELAARVEARDVERCFAAMAQEVIHGQYLEVLITYALAPSEDELTRVLRLKSGRYSVERPLELGALLAGASAAVVGGLKSVGQALGEAFQLRDDLLGMLGDPDAVGKPVGADWAEGKFTFLAFHALGGASPEDRAFLAATRGAKNLGPTDLRRVLRLLDETGAVARVETMIRERLAAARDGLAALPLREPGAGFLAGLVDFLEEPNP